MNLPCNHQLSWPFWPHTGAFQFLTPHRQELLAFCSWSAAARGLGTQWLPTQRSQWMERLPPGPELRTEWKHHHDEGVLGWNIWWSEMSHFPVDIIQAVLCCRRALGKISCGFCGPDQPTMRQELFKATAVGPLAIDVSSPITSLRNVGLRSQKRTTFKSPTASKECLSKWSCWILLQVMD